MTRTPDPGAEVAPVASSAVARASAPGEAAPQPPTRGAAGKTSPQRSRERAAAGKPDPVTGAVLGHEAASGRERAPDPAGGAVDADAVLSAGSTGRTFTITLPAGLKLLSLNDRGHWATRYRRAEAFKEAAWAMALKGKVPRLERVFVAAVYQPPPDWRERDSDNPMLSVKAAIDGIVAAKVLPSDACPRYVTGVYCTIGEPHPAGRLVLNLLAYDPVRELGALAGLGGAA